MGQTVPSGEVYGVRRYNNDDDSDALGEAMRGVRGVAVEVVSEEEEMVQEMYWAVK